MGQPFVGEIRMVGFNFEPVGWYLCDGRLLAISENTVLFQLIGTTYGGDGQTTFALPDLRGRGPVHQGGGQTIGEAAGTETVTVGVTHLPAHAHAATASGGAQTTDRPAGAVPAVPGWYDNLAVATPSTQLGTTGGGQPVGLRSPFETVSFVISAFGIYPSQ